MTSFASLLWGHRVLTQQELAERAGLTTNAISALKQGRWRRPCARTVRCAVVVRRGAGGAHVGHYSRQANNGGRRVVLIGPGAVVETWFLTVVGLLGVNLLLAPLQAAGEEYGLRGLVFRVASSWARGRWAGLVLRIVVSSFLFAAIHASTDPVLNGYYLAFAVVLAIVTWRTGGVETAVVVYALTNVLTFTFGVGVREDLAGGLASGPGTSPT